MAKNLFPINWRSFDDKQRHDYILQTYILNKQQSQERHKRDVDVIREHHRFLWDSDDEQTTAASANDSWEQRLARRYYDKLFKEYCIADLTRYKENKVALRWRTEAEVVEGIGQFKCGSRKCTISETLRSWEVNFAYMEKNVRKNALVKLRLCTEHSAQLNYTSQKREIKRLKSNEKEARRQAKRAQRQERRKHGKTKRETTPEGNEAAEMEKSETLDAENAQFTETIAAADHEEVIEEENTEDVWRKQPDLTKETITREHEFERYLEDLLL